MKSKNMKIISGIFKKSEKIMEDSISKAILRNGRFMDLCVYVQTSI